MSSEGGTRDIASLLLQDYEVDPGSIEFLLEEALQIAPDGPVRVSCFILRRMDLTQIRRKNLSLYVQRAIRDERLRRLFEKAAKKHGRCPNVERGWLRNQLAATSADARSRPRAASVETEILDLSDISVSIDQVPALLNLMGAGRPPGSLKIRLNDFTYASGLAILAQWILANQMERGFEFECSPAMQAYLDDIRFSAALRNRQIMISPNPMDWAIGLTRINRDQPTEIVTKKIVEILQVFVNPSPGDLQALEVLISEMIENVHRHAASPVDGFAVAQVYPKKLKMGITLVDAGMGIRKSFEEGDASVDVSSFGSDADFLHEATRLYSTSKKTRHSGYGLFLLAELIRRNRGTLLLTSGSASLIGYARSGGMHFDEVRHAPWSGTIVSVIIDLHNQLPLLDIYREMPSDSHDESLFVE